MLEPPNPYAAPRVDAAAALPDPIPFAGDVTVADVASLMPKSLVNYVALLPALLIGIPLVAVLAFAIAVGDIPPSEVVVASTLMLLFFLALPTLVFWWSRRLRRAALLVAEHPTMIGAIRGALSPQGVKRDDSHESATFPWCMFNVIDVRPAGVRLQAYSDDVAFIALPAHCFASYDRRAIRSAIDAFRSAEAAGLELGSDALSAPAAWSKPPDDAICFAGTVSDEDYGIAPERFGRVVQLAIAPLAGILLLVLAARFEMDLVAVLLFGAVISGIYQTAKQFRSWRERRRSPFWRQRGWVTSDRIYVAMLGKDYHDNWQVVERLSHDSNALTIVWRDQSQLVIPRRHLVDPQQWELLLETAAVGLDMADVD